MKKIFKIALVLIASMCGVASHAAYPDQPIRIVVPTAAGGGSDLLTRLIAKKLTTMWGQSVIVEIKPGASGVIGGAYVAQSKPDGYTLLMITNMHSATAVLFKHLAYDPVKSFEPVAPIGSTPMVLEVNGTAPVNSVSQLVAAAKKAPGSVSFGSAGNASPSQLGGELLSSMSKTKMIHVPFKGAGEATSSLLGNHITYAFSNPMSTLSLVKQGQLKALAVSGSQRLRSLPDVPTVSESGYPGFDVSTWWGLLAPKGTPTAVLEKLNAAINQIIHSPDMQQQFGRIGIDATGGSRADFQNQINKEMDVWRKLVAEGKVTPQ